MKRREKDKSLSKTNHCQYQVPQLISLHILHIKKTIREYEE